MKNTPDEVAELRAAISALRDRFGAKAVKAEVLAQTEIRRGAPQIADFSVLHPQLERDARKLLAGESYLEIDNARIARDFAAQHPSSMTNAQSIKRRIKRKLQKRELFVLYNAFLISGKESPWRQHRAVTERLAELDGALGIWDKFLKWRDLQLLSWREHYGELPESHTFEKIEGELKLAPSGGMAPNVRPGH